VLSGLGDDSLSVTGGRRQAWAYPARSQGGRAGHLDRPARRPVPLVAAYASRLPGRHLRLRLSDHGPSPILHASLLMVCDHAQLGRSADVIAAANWSYDACWVSVIVWMTPLISHWVGLWP